jgi:hypothetical protein
LKVEQANQDIDPSIDIDETAGLSDEEIAERKLLSENAAVIEEMRSKYEDIEIYPAPKGFSGIVIIAAPTNPKVFQNLVNQLAKESTDKAVELVNFAITCTVFPKERAEVKAMYAKRGAFALKMASVGQELCGSETKALGKG